MRTCKRMGIKTVAVYSDADQNSLHVRLADEAVNVVRWRMRVLLQIKWCRALLQQAKVIWAFQISLLLSEQRAPKLYIPVSFRSLKQILSGLKIGYGFLSENSKFVHALDEIGVTFIGPSESSMAAMGDKIESKILAKKSGVNTIPGYNGVVKDTNHAIQIGW